MAETILQKITFLKKAEQFRALTLSDSFFQHLSIVMDLLSEKEFDYFIQYALETNPHKTLDLETYPRLQNSSCMQIIQLLKKLDSPFIGFSKKSLFAAKEERKEVEDLSLLKMDHKEFQLREYAWLKFSPENENLPLDQYKQNLADFEDYFNDFQNNSELMADFDDWLEAHPPFELKKTNTKFFEEKKILTCREEAELGFKINGFK